MQLERKWLANNFEILLNWLRLLGKSKKVNLEKEKFKIKIKIRPFKTSKNFFLENEEIQFENESS